MSKINKTITLVVDHNPVVSILPGHVGAVEFNKAHKAEGWHGDWVYKDNLYHEYWIKTKTTWRRSDSGNKKAIKVTVMNW